MTWSGGGSNSRPLVCRSMSSFIQPCALLNWNYFRFRCGCTPVPVNLNCAVISPYFAIFKSVVHSYGNRVFFRCKGSVYEVWWSHFNFMSQPLTHFARSICMPGYPTHGTPIAPPRHLTGFRKNRLVFLHTWRYAEWCTAGHSCPANRAHRAFF